MASNRSPDVSYNGSGYFDRTARDAICRADRDLLKLREMQLMNHLQAIAEKHGFRIYGKVNLVDIRDDYPTAERR